ncbi:DUF4239 domain-containing protein [Aquitalea palustris]|uniref:DUF4239 domain-containing protein n=1 Tax=Aquitalea palustris TaxID=2480983 RepID=A0A454JK45_9NEIS|nr:DUF4239 domain-containing protein [Aquitalea palustris]RMC99603.1 DUF4239 domain-containing protein [Aquitalea palustris]
MKIFIRCGIVVFATFIFAIAGEVIHQQFPEYVAHSGELIKLVSSLIGTLFAIVLGLLISSSYTAFNTHQADFNAMATAIANIDLILKYYPASTKNMRHSLMLVVDEVLNRYWPKHTVMHNHDVDYRFLENDINKILLINSSFHNISNVKQDDINAMRNHSNNFISIQANIIRNLSSQVPSLLLYVVFGWACLLFFLYGIFGNGTAFEFSFLFLGSIAIASTNFLILELTHPYQGLFKISSAALDLLKQSISLEDEKIFQS